METARLSSKGQVTIPVGIRRMLGLQMGENIIFIERSGNVFIMSESGLYSSMLKDRSKETTDLLRFGEDAGKILSEPDDFLPKDKRREILRSLYGSINDQTVTEPPEVDNESPRDWGLMDQ